MLKAGPDFSPHDYYYLPENDHQLVNMTSRHSKINKAVEKD